jgi:hypothetical protein
MIELFREDEIQKSGLSAGDLRMRFRDQLIKDFEMSNLGDHLSPMEDLSYESIHKNVKDALDKIMKAGGSLYQQLLYRIDISEKQLNKALISNGGRQESDVIAEVIIKRILQKVILKVIYSK